MKLNTFVSSCLKKYHGESERYSGEVEYNMMRRRETKYLHLAGAYKQAHGKKEGFIQIDMGKALTGYLFTEIEVGNSVEQQSDVVKFGRSGIGSKERNVVWMDPILVAGDANENEKEKGKESGNMEREREMEKAKERRKGRWISR